MDLTGVNERDFGRVLFLVWGLDMLRLGWRGHDLRLFLFDGGLDGFRRWFLRVVHGLTQCVVQFIDGRLKLTQVCDRAHENSQRLSPLLLNQRIACLLKPVLEFQVAGSVYLDLYLGQVRL